MSRRILTLAVVLLWAFAGAAWAEKASDKEKPVKPGAGLTIYLDISIASRKHRAAKKMTALHKKHYDQGWTVVDVDPYIENGDLQGFFITYVGREASK